MNCKLTYENLLTMRFNAMWAFEWADSYAARATTIKDYNEFKAEAKRYLRIFNYIENRMKVTERWVA